MIAWVSAASFFTEHMSVITALAHQDRRRRTHSGHFWLVRRCDAPVGQINEYLNMDPPATSGNVWRTVKLRRAHVGPHHNPSVLPS